MSMDCLRSKLITLISVQRESFTIVILHNNNCFRCLLLIFFHFPSISFRPEMLRGLFDKYGELGDVYIPRDYQTRQPRGFAFVRFANRSDGEEAQRALDGTTLDGRVLAILEAQKGRAENPKQAMTERGPPPRDHDRRWGNERDHRPRVGGDGDGYGYYEYGDRGRDYHDYDRRRGGDYGYDYDRERGYGDRAGYRDNYNYSSSGSSRDNGYGYDPVGYRGYEGGRGRDYDYDYGRRGAPPPAAGYGRDRRYLERSPPRDRDRGMPMMPRGGERYREGTGAAAQGDKGRNESDGNGGSPAAAVAASRPLRSRTRSRSRDRAL